MSNNGVKSTWPLMFVLIQRPRREQAALEKSIPKMMRFLALFNTVTFHEMDAFQQLSSCCLQWLPCRTSIDCINSEWVSQPTIMKSDSAAKIDLNTNTSHYARILTLKWWRFYWFNIYCTTQNQLQLTTMDTPHKLHQSWRSTMQFLYWLKTNKCKSVSEMWNQTSSSCFEMKSYHVSLLCSGGRQAYRPVSWLVLYTYRTNQETWYAAHRHRLRAAR